MCIFYEVSTVVKVQRLWDAQSLRGSIYITSPLPKAQESLRKKEQKGCKSQRWWVTGRPEYLGSGRSQSGTGVRLSCVQSQKPHLENSRSEDHSLPCPGSACPGPRSPALPTFVSTTVGQSQVVSPSQVRFPFL